MLKLAIAQLNYTVGDFSGNVRAMTAKMQLAAEQNADVVVFSELALYGYYPGDLLEEPQFLARLDHSLQDLLAATRHHSQLVVVVGTVRKNTGPGKPLYNALLAIRDGAIVAEYHKQLLPTYGIFDEGRHFQAG